MCCLALARARLRREARDDRGFALLYVLGITTIVSVLVAATLVVTASQIVPSVHAAYEQAADAAAQSGLQDFVAYLDDASNCQNLDVSDCAAKLGISATTAKASTVKTVVSEGSYASTFQWWAKAYVSSDPTKQYIRVKSLGHVQQNGQAATKVVVGDIVPGALLNDLDYGVITGFETQSSASVLADWPQRTIALSPAAIAAADQPIKGSSITWSGSSPGKAAGKVAVCNATYNDPVVGRSVNPPPNSPNPYVDYAESGLGGNNYTDYEPCHTSWGNMTRLLAPANPNNGVGGYFSRDALLLSNSYPGGTGPVFNQPVTTTWQFTNVNDNVCSTTAGQNFRSFNLVCAGYPVEVGGTPASNSNYPNVQWRQQGPQLPAVVNYNAVLHAKTCIYAGPTRVRLHADDTATVTSPETTLTWSAQQTAAGYPAQCYAGANDATGMAEQTVSLSGITLLRVSDNGNTPTATPGVAHGSTGWPTTGQQLYSGKPSVLTQASTANSVFYLTSGTSGTTTDAPVYTVTTPDTYTPVVADNPSTKSDGSWNPQWTSYTSGSSCSSATNLTDLKFFNCFVPKDSYSDSYSWLKAKVKAAIAANPQNYTTATQLQNLVTSFVSQGNSSDSGNAAPSKTDYTSHRWTVSAGSTTTGSCAAATGVAGATSDTPITAPSSDPLFSNSAGNVHAAESIDTSCVNIKVTLQIGTCNVALVLGACVNLGNYVWGNGTAMLGGGQSVSQFQLTATVKKSTTTRTTTQAVSSFPSMSDVTQYQMGFDNTGAKGNDTFGPNGPGDLYVEGEVGHTMAIVGDDDVVVTGSIGTTGTNPAHPSATGPNGDSAPSTSTSALQIVGRNNVRILHPVQCNNSFSLAAATWQDEISATDPGFCPNDLTGLYDSVLPDNARPSMQYSNLRPDLAGLTMHAAVFALGNSAQHETCPGDQTADQYTNGNGNSPWCGGELTVDNYSRATSLGYVTDIGTLGMAHHSPFGQEWRIADSQPAASPYTRPYSGYQLAQQYENLKARLKAAGLAALLDTSSLTSGLWHIASISTGNTP
jgi:hypothetical protein